ncbi:hypothetical protein FRC00_008693, partial [Tulasnella sp. 408]
LEQIVESHEGKTLHLNVWNSKYRAIRPVPIIPSRKWALDAMSSLQQPPANPSLLGLSMRLCEPESALEHVWHILEILEGSPAESAGLVPYGDWIVGWSGGVLSKEGDFYEVVEQHEEKPLRVYVYSLDFDTLREVVLVPNRMWGGEGLLGCGVGYGLLHRIPRISATPDDSYEQVDLPAGEEGAEAGNHYDDHEHASSNPADARQDYGARRESLFVPADEYPEYDASSAINGRFPPPAPAPSFQTYHLHDQHQQAHPHPHRHDHQHSHNHAHDHKPQQPPPPPAANRQPPPLPVPEVPIVSPPTPQMQPKQFSRSHSLDHTRMTTNSTFTITLTLILTPTLIPTLPLIPMIMVLDTVMTTTMAMRTVTTTTTAMGTATATIMITPATDILILMMTTTLMRTLFLTIILMNQMIAQVPPPTPSAPIPIPAPIPQKPSTLTSSSPTTPPANTSSRLAEYRKHQQHQHSSSSRSGTPDIRRSSTPDALKQLVAPDWRLGSPRLGGFPALGLGGGDMSGRRASGIGTTMANDMRRGGSGLPGFPPSPAPSSPKVAVTTPSKSGTTIAKLSDEDSDGDRETLGGSVTSVD